MSARMERIGACELWLGDCREILPTVGRVDAVVTDPPYEIKALGGGIGSRRAYLADVAGKIDGGFDVAVLAGQVNWFVFCGRKQIVGLIECAERAGLRWQLLTWNKTNPTPLSYGNYLPDTEYMVHAFVTHKWESKTRFVVGQVERNEFDHPTVKPQYVMLKAIRSASAVGDVVADPYMGTGSTGVACCRSGRRFIGIEIEPRYFDIACRRIEAAYRQADLFIKQPESAA